ncbi:hypothetical protein PoB_001110300 [Plakobranchus ocellatus]|uniref:Uncharacterized protein n=1 Tax=Plakobranchus ocellatus TaxID=259542 RepID=A0AAV3YQI6_9GAST|nr:hypothetical protein PoB_001110300 [Plakobranchus ocellatus]
MHGYKDDKHDDDADHGDTDDDDDDDDGDYDDDDDVGVGYRALPHCVCSRQAAGQGFPRDLISSTSESTEPRAFIILLDCQRGRCFIAPQ